MRGNFRLISSSASSPWDQRSDLFEIGIVRLARTVAAGADRPRHQAVPSPGRSEPGPTEPTRLASGTRSVPGQLKYAGLRPLSGITRSDNARDSARSSSADRAGLFVLTPALPLCPCSSPSSGGAQPDGAARARLVDQDSRLVRALAAIPQDGLSAVPGRPNPSPPCSAPTATPIWPTASSPDPRASPSPKSPPRPHWRPAAGCRQTSPNGSATPVDSGARARADQFPSPLLHDGPPLEGFVRVAFRAPTPSASTPARSPSLAGLALPIRSSCAVLLHAAQPAATAAGGQPAGRTTAANAPPDAPAARRRDLVTRFGALPRRHRSASAKLEAGRGERRNRHQAAGLQARRSRRPRNPARRRAGAGRRQPHGCSPTPKGRPAAVGRPAALVGKRPTEWPVEERRPAPSPRC